MNSMSNRSLFGSTNPSFGFSPSQNDGNKDPSAQNKPQFGTMQGSSNTSFGGVTKPNQPAFGFGNTQPQTFAASSLFRSTKPNDQQGLFSSQKEDLQQNPFGVSTSSSQPGLFLSQSKITETSTQPKLNFAAAAATSPGVQQGLFSSENQGAQTQQKPDFGSPSFPSAQQGLFSSATKDQTKTDQPKYSFGIPSSLTPGAQPGLFSSDKNPNLKKPKPDFGATQFSGSGNPMFGKPAQSSKTQFQSNQSETFSQTKSDRKPVDATQTSFSFKPAEALPKPGFFSAQTEQKQTFGDAKGQSLFSGNSGGGKPLMFGTSNPSANVPSLFQGGSTQQVAFGGQAVNKLGRKRSLDDVDGSKSDEKQETSLNQADGKKPEKRIARGPAPGLFSRAMMGTDIKIKPSQSKQMRQKPSVKTVTPLITSRTPLRKRTSATSPTEAASVASSTALNCTHVPEQFNNNQTLKESFSKFGKVTFARGNPVAGTALIKFATHEEANLAKQKGKFIFGTNHEIFLYFRKPRRSTTENTEGPQTTKNPPIQPPVAKRIEKNALVRTGSVRQRRFPVTSTFTKTSGAFYAKTDGEKLKLLEKIDKILRSQTVKESNILKAKVAIGTCPDMCPEKERYLRLDRNLLAGYEMDSNKKLVHSLAVKEYSRSSADQEEALAHELRPSPILRVAMDYLLTHVMNKIDYEKIADWYDFLWNRTRAIRKEISIQQLNDAMAVEVAEECARFHICCGHELCAEDRLNFDPKINNENLEKAMKSVLDMYADVRTHQNNYLRNESEFLAYHILLNINKSSDVLRELRSMSDAIRETPDVKLAVAVFTSVHSNNYTRYFNLLKHSTYLQASILHRYFEQVRRQAVLTMARAYSPKSVASLPIEHLRKVLHFNDEQELISFCEDHMIPVKNGFVELSRSESYEAEGGMVLTKSHEISMKVQGRNLGEVIAHNREPSYEIHQPVSSFDENGRYVGPHAALLNLKEQTSAPPAGETADVISTKLQQKGVSDLDVKAITIQLFREVIEEMVDKLSGEVIKATVQVTASIKVCSDIIDDVITEQVRKLSHTELVTAKLKEEERIAREEQAAREAAIRAQQEAERRRIQKLKEEEERRRKKEKDEIIARCVLSLGDELQTEVAAKMAAEIATEEFREAQLNFMSDIITDDITSSTVHESLTEVVTSVVREERKAKLATINKKLHTRLAVILFQRWQRVLANLRRQRHAQETFPSAPFQRDIHQQISDLLPSGCGEVEGNKPDRFPLDKMQFCELTLEPATRLYEKHDKTVKGLRVTTTIGVKLRQSAMEDEYPLPAMFCDNHTQKITANSGEVLNLWWKICINFSSLNRNIVKWIRKKFACLNKDSAISSKTFIEHFSKAVVKVTTCTKITGDSIKREDFLGCSSLIFVVTENVTLSKAKAHLETILDCKPAIPPVNVLFFVETYTESTIINELDLENLRKKNMLGNYQVKVWNEEYLFVDNNRQMESGLRWLARELSSPPSIQFKTLQDVLEEQVSLQYITPMQRHQVLREKLNLPKMEPNDVVTIYNHIIARICEVLTKDELLEVSWPPTEMTETGGLLPPNTNHLWNTNESFDKIDAILTSIQLPQFPDLAHGDTADKLQQTIILYCQQVCPHHPVLLSTITTSMDGIFRKIIRSSFLNENQFTLVELIPWQSVIDAIASSLFQQVIYDKHVADRVVGYFPMDMELVKIPKECSQMFADVEFEAIQDNTRREKQERVYQSETIHSLTEGASHNLTQIVNQTQMNTESDHEVDRNVDSSTLDVVEDTSTLKRGIENERRESERFECRLQELLDDGGSLNYSFEPGDLSLLFS